MTPATFNPAGWTVNNNPVTTVTWVAPTMLTVTTGTTINPIDGYVFPALANGPTGVNGLTPLSAGGTVNTV